MFEGRIAIVTGAASAQGQGVVRALLRRRATVVLADRDRTEAAATARRLDPDGGRTLAVAIDANDPISVAAAVGLAVSRCGGLDLAVNAAGVPSDDEAVEAGTDAAAWERLLALNLAGIFHGMKYEIPAMLARGGGAIVNVYSAADLTGETGAAPYLATRHGIVGLTRAAALDYASKGVRINAIGPGDVAIVTRERAHAGPPRVAPCRSPAGGGASLAMPVAAPVVRRRMLTPRFGTADEVGDLVCFLLSRDAALITGSFYFADGQPMH